MPRANWSVLIFGDSWADYMHPTWPQVLGRRLGASVHNFAQGGSLCGDIRSQGQRALMSPQVSRPGGSLPAETLIVVHTCGNDFIMKMAEAFMGGGALSFLGMGGASNMATPEMLQPNPGVREVAIIKEFMESMHRAGARNFLVSGVPIFLDMPVFNMAMPIITGMVNSGKLEALGVSPGDPPRLAVEVQAIALHDRWEEMVQEFNKMHSNSCCVFFDEVAALERLRLSFGPAVFDRSMWDFSMFHPTAWGHEQLAAEAHRISTQEFPGLKEPAAAAPAAPPKAAYAAPAAGGLASPAGLSNGTSEVQTNGDKKLKVHIRNVKGDVAFEVMCNANWKTSQLTQAVLEKAPSGFADSSCACVFAMKGKFLSEAETLEKMGVQDGVQLIAVVKPKSAQH